MEPSQARGGAATRFPPAAMMATQRLLDLARRHAQGRIVSCLEGGYALGALARSVAAHLRVLADVAY